MHNFANSINFSARSVAVSARPAVTKEEITQAEKELQSALEHLHAVLQKQEDQGGLSIEQKAGVMLELARCDEAMQQAENFGKAARAAAVCGLRG